MGSGIKEGKMVGSGKFKESEWTAFWAAILASFVFVGIIWAAGSFLDDIELLPDQGSSWYFWKLPVPTLWSRITSWGLYSLHQIAIWVIVAKALKERPHPGSLGPLNKAALWINGIFIVLHFIQTHLFYDGLAQDVPIWTSQYSVIVMLVLILLMLVPRRGLFFGKKKKLPKGLKHALGRYHGFYISWALIYTFWFHPMENDFGILIGFLYMFFLFTQMSLFNTKVHFSMPWIIFIEVFVAFHGTMIAIMNNQPIWTMFLFGFLFMFVFTQMHGFKMPVIAKAAVFILYFTGIAVAYSFRGYDKLYELSFIPGTLYAGVFIIGFLTWLFLKVKALFREQSKKQENKE